MINPAFFVGAPLEFHEKCLIYPPTIKEVVSNPHFGQYRHILTTAQEELNDELLPKLNINEHVPTPLEFILANSYQNKVVEKLAYQAFEFFIHMPVTFLYDQKMILLGDINELLKDHTSIDSFSCIKEDEFFEFQNLIREACGIDRIEPYVEDPNEDPRIRRIKAKARYRDRIKAQHGSKNGITFATSLVAICCTGFGITPLNIGEMSYASVSPLLKMFQDKEKYDLDIRALLAGASSKKVHPQYWIKND